MDQQLSSSGGSLSVKNVKLLRVLFLSLLALSVFTYFAVYQDEAKTLPALGFWESHHHGHSSAQKRAQDEQPLWKPAFLGEVNMHVFEDWCGGSVSQLRANVLYPLFPHTRTTIGRLAINAGWKNYGVRIFGYLHPVKTDEYIFAVASDNNAEIWLSSDDSPKGVKLIAYLGKTGNEWAAPGEYEKFSSQTSLPVLLTKDKRYFFEVLYKQSEGIDHLEVAWRLNNEDSSFEVITAEYLSLYVDESSLLMTENDHIPQTKASHQSRLDSAYKTVKDVDMVKADSRDFIYSIPLLEESNSENLFPECDYYPIYIFDNETIERYDGINYVHYSAVYPNDHTRLTHEQTDDQKCFYEKDEAYFKEGGFSPFLKIDEKADNKKPVPKSLSNSEEKEPNWEQVFHVNALDFHSKQSDAVMETCRKAGNIIMLKKEVMPVVQALINQLHTTKATSDFHIKRVLNVERKSNETTGTRYLMELELEDTEGKRFLFSKYLYLTKEKKIEKNPGLPKLCSPKGFSWNPKATVHVVLAVKNQGRWIMHFIKEMEKIYKATGDKNFNIIIIDYNSTDIDVEKELKNAILPSYQFKRLGGAFGRSPGLQEGIDLVQDNSSILFLCDLHLNFPVTIIDTIRKHCVQGKMAFAPVVMRLECGATVQAPAGFWETYGYGLVGIYKSDIIRIGGMNTQEFTDKWGGEDWELLDRILLHKLEVERLNLRNFLHFFHTRHGMWNEA